MAAGQCSFFPAFLWGWLAVWLVVIAAPGFCAPVTPVVSTPILTSHEDLSPVVTGSTLVYTLEGDRLVGRDRRTGRRRWTFGHSLSRGPYYRSPGQAMEKPAEAPGQILLAGDTVYTYSRTAVLYAVNAQTGRLRWQADLGLGPLGITTGKVRTGDMAQVQGLEADLSGVVVSDTEALLAYDKHGKRMWRVKAAHGNNFPDMEGGLVLVTRCEDPMYVGTTAYDRWTGRLLWQQAGQVERVSDGVAEISLGVFHGDPQPHFDYTQFQVDARTGAVVSRTAAAP